jgi:hypothetical protein
VTGTEAGRYRQMVEPRACPGLRSGVPAGANWHHTLPDGMRISGVGSAFRKQEDRRDAGPNKIYVEVRSKNGVLTKAGGIQLSG